MSKELQTLNIIWAVIDTLICGLSIAAFGWGAYHFDRWWLLPFVLIPLALFNQHSLIVDADMEAAKRNQDD